MTLTQINFSEGNAYECLNNLDGNGAETCGIQEIFLSIHCSAICRFIRNTIISQQMEDLISLLTLKQSKKQF